MVCSFQRVEVILPVQCPRVLILSDTGGTMETCAPTPTGWAREAEQLRRFRTRFYRCLTGWADAAFELCEAALSLGRIDHEGMRDLLVAHRPTTVAGRVRRRRLHLGALRRRNQPRAGLLLLCVQTLGLLGGWAVRYQHVAHPF